MNGATMDPQAQFDAFTMSAVAQAMPTAQFNPYLEDNSGMAAAGSYYASATNYAAPAQPVSFVYPTLLRPCN